MMQKGVVRVCDCGQILTFQVEGWGRMYQSLPIRRLSEKGLNQGIRTIRVDLSHCTYLDSTFLGTLLYLKRTIQRRGMGELVLMSPSPACCRLFQQLGVADCFFIQMGDGSGADGWSEVPCDEPEDVEAFNQNVIQAHQELASLGGPSGDTFKQVSRSIEQERRPEGEP
jgi:anti-sigma B factor antagonist